MPTVHVTLLTTTATKSLECMQVSLKQLQEERPLRPRLLCILRPLGSHRHSEVQGRITCPLAWTLYVEPRRFLGHLDANAQKRHSLILKATGGGQKTEGISHFDSVAFGVGVSPPCFINRNYGNFYRLPLISCSIGGSNI